MLRAGDFFSAFLGFCCVRQGCEHCNRLVYYESFNDVHKAIEREKQLSGWVRRNQVALIESMNPRWQDDIY